MFWVEAAPIFLRSSVGRVSADLTYPDLSRMTLAVEADEVHNKCRYETSVRWLVCCLKRIARRTLLRKGED